MLKKAIFTALLSFGLVAGAAVADTLVVDKIAATADESRPARGAQKDSVAKSLGQPTAAQSAVGEPPISAWEYDEFVVYFEHDRVLHTVAKR